MADPFALKERFPSKPPMGQGGMSAASLSLSILPGKGLEESGKSMGKATDRFHKLSLKRKETADTMEAKDHANTFLEAALPYHQDMMTRVRDLDDEEWLIDGNRVPFLEYYKHGLTALQDSIADGSYKPSDGSVYSGTSNESVTNKYHLRTSDMVTSYFMDAMKEDFELENKRIIKQHEKTADQSANRFQIAQSDIHIQNIDKGEAFNNPEVSLPFWENFNRSLKEELEDLKANTSLGKTAIFIAFSETQRKYSKAAIQSFIDAKDPEAALIMLNQGITRTGDPFTESDEAETQEEFYKKLGTEKEHFFHLESHEYTSLLRSIKSATSDGVQGLLPRIHNHVADATTAYSLGNNNLGDKLSNDALSLLNISNVKPEAKKTIIAQLKAEKLAAIDFRKTSLSIGRIPFNERASVINDFEKRNTGGGPELYQNLGYRNVQLLKRRLLDQSGKERELFDKDPATYAQFHGTGKTRDLLKRSNEQRQKGDISGSNLLFQAYQKDNLSFQRKMNREKNFVPQLLTAQQSEEIIDNFSGLVSSLNLQNVEQYGKESLNKVNEELDALVDQFGPYLNAALVELENPKEHKDNYDGKSMPKSVGIAIPYKPLVRQRLIAAMNSKKEIMQEFQGSGGTVNDVFRELVNSDEYKKFASSTRHGVYRSSAWTEAAKLYALSKLSQEGPGMALWEGTKDLFGAIDSRMQESVKETIEELITDKYDFFQNPDTDVWVTIPKTYSDNTGFDSKYIKDTLGYMTTNMKEDPDLVNRLLMEDLEDVVETKVPKDLPNRDAAIKLELDKMRSMYKGTIVIISTPDGAGIELAQEQDGQVFPIPHSRSLSFEDISRDGVFGDLADEIDDYSNGVVDDIISIFDETYYRGATHDAHLRLEMDTPIDVHPSINKLQSALETNARLSQTAKQELKEKVATLKGTLEGKYKAIDRKTKQVPPDVREQVDSIKKQLKEEYKHSKTAALVNDPMPKQTGTIDKRKPPLLMDQVLDNYTEFQEVLQSIEDSIIVTQEKPGPSAKIAIEGFIDDHISLLKRAINKRKHLGMGTLANAIYSAEGGKSARYPYGYKNEIMDYKDGKWLKTNTYKRYSEEEARKEVLSWISRRMDEWDSNEPPEMLGDTKETRARGLINQNPTKTKAKIKDTDEFSEDFLSWAGEIYTPAGRDNNPPESNKWNLVKQQLKHMKTPFKKMKEEIRDIEKKLKYNYSKRDILTLQHLNMVIGKQLYIIEHSMK